MYKKYVVFFSWNIIKVCSEPSIDILSTTCFFKITVEQHPNMKEIVVREVEQLLFRPNIAERAQYV